MALITMAQAVTNLEKDPAIQKMIAKLKAEQVKSPARHARKYSGELMQISPLINFYCEQIGNITAELVYTDDDFTGKRVRDTEYDNELFAMRDSHITKLGVLQKQYKKVVKRLDQAIIDEDNGV